MTIGSDHQTHDLPVIAIVGGGYPERQLHFICCNGGHCAPVSFSYSSRANVLERDLPMTRAIPPIASMCRPPG